MCSRSGAASLGSVASVDADLIQKANNKSDWYAGSSINKTYKEKANDLKKLADMGTLTGKMATKEELQGAIAEVKRAAEQDLNNYITRGKVTHNTNNTYKEIRKRWYDRITTHSRGGSGDSTTY